tara:strand:+ start:2158 stop:4071 length:1914 start_codon:yes stop_codon:yes gene_type:complete
MPERQKTEFNIGFAPTQVQQTDTSSVFMPAKERKSAKTKMFEQLASLSGTVLNQVIKWDRSKNLKEAQANKLTPELKKEFKAHADRMAAEKDPNKKKALADQFFANVIKTDERMALYSPVINQMKEESTATLQMENHFNSLLEDPETYSQLIEDNSLNIDAWFNQQRNFINFGSNQFSDSAAVQTAFNVIKNRHISTIRSQRISRGVQDMHQKFQDDTVFTINNALELGGDLGTVLKNRGDVIYSSTKQNGVDDVLAGVTVSLNDRMDSKDFTGAKQIIDALNDAEYSNGFTLQRLDPETVQKLEASYLTAKEANDKAVETKNNQIALQASKKLELGYTRWAQSLSDSTETVDGEEVPFQFSRSTTDQLLLKYEAEVFAKNNANKNPSVQDLKDDALWAIHRDNVEKDIRARRNAEKVVTSQAFASEYNKLKLNPETSPEVLGAELKQGLQDGLLSISDFNTLSGEIEVLGNSFKFITEHNKRYTDLRSQFKGSLRNRLGVLGELTFTEEAMAFLSDPKRKLYEAGMLQINEETRLFREKEYKLSQKLVPGVKNVYDSNYTLAQLNADLRAYSNERIALYQKVEDTTKITDTGVSEFMGKYFGLKKNAQKEGGVEDFLVSPDADTGGQNENVQGLGD